MLRLGGVALSLALVCCACVGADDDLASRQQPNGAPTTSTDQQEPAPTPPPAARPDGELPDPQRWATVAERAWLSSYNKWTKTFLDSLAAFPTEDEEMAELNAGEPEALQELVGHLTSWETCASALATKVPPAPTVRLQEVVEQAHALCLRLENVFTILEEASKADEPQPQPVLRAGRELRRGVTLIGVIADRLPPGGTQPVPIVDGPAPGNHVNPTYGRAAGEAAELATEVRCWSERAWRRLLREATAFTGTRFHPADTAGFTSAGSRRVHLAPLVCAALDELVYGKARPRDLDGRIALSVAVNTLAHEAMHRAGILDEATAECYGMQHVTSVAQEVGVARRYARELASLALMNYRGLPAEYRSRDCRRGGPLDLEDGDGPWSR
jgi:hypothetical protein